MQGTETRVFRLETLALGLVERPPVGADQKSPVEFKKSFPSTWTENADTRMFSPS